MQGLLIAIGVVAVILGIALAFTLMLATLMHLTRKHQLPKVSEWQARKNSAPLTNAIIETHVSKRENHG